jgi:uncharacterized phage protein (TIGR01671 family)
MSREFKFRVYSFVDKEFIYFDIYDYPQGIAGGVSEPQQYTGLNDKNGKEIYEGDIVKDTWKENRPYSYSPDEEYDCEKIFEVKYEDYSFNLDRKYSREQTCVDDFHREVIGNIFEHKHLLEK